MCIGSGRGGDLNKYIKYGFTNLYLVEPDENNRTELINRISQKKNFVKVETKFSDYEQNKGYKYKIGSMYGQDVPAILADTEGTNFDAVVYMLSLSYFFDNKSDILTIIKLAKSKLKSGGYFAAFSINGNKIRAMQKIPGYFLGNTLNLKQITMTVENDKDVYVKIGTSRTANGIKEFLTDLNYLDRLFLANGFTRIEFADVPIDLGLNGEERIYNSLFSTMIYQKL